MHYFSWSNINVKRDITAILSITSCEDTWRLFKAAQDENLLHMAISGEENVICFDGKMIILVLESDCPRLPTDQAVTVPLITAGEEMPQIVLDLRTFNAYRWKSAVIIYDETLGLYT